MTAKNIKHVGNNSIPSMPFWEIQEYNKKRVDKPETLLWLASHRKKESGTKKSFKELNSYS